MSLDLIFFTVMQNFVMIRSAVLEKMAFEVAIFGNFLNISEPKLSIPPWVRGAGCDVVLLHIMQSYRSCTLCKRKTRGKTQFWIALAAPTAPSILTNYNEIPTTYYNFIIFLTPISCDGSIHLWRQHQPCSL